MSLDVAVVLCKDDTLLYTRYENTSDTLDAALSDKFVDTDLRASLRQNDDCTCAKKWEDAVVATWDMSWDVLICRRCQVIVSGRAPYGLESWGGGVIEKPVEIRDEPGWFTRLILNSPK